MTEQLAMTLICGGLMTVGVLGIVLPVLPGSLLIGGAMAVWAFLIPSTPAKVIAGVAIVVLLIGQVVQYTRAGKSLKSSGVPTRSLLAGGLLGVVGMWVIPVVGLPLGFVLGLYLAESHRLKGFGESVGSAKAALRAVGLAIVIELIAASASIAIWAVAVLVYFATR